MGLLSAGTPLSWPDSEPFRKRVQRDGIDQFLAVFREARHFSNHGLKWGDEVEYMLVNLKPDAARLSLRGPELIEILQREEHAQPAGSSVPVLWRPEYARWMVEGTPGLPYRCYAADLALVERNMVLRRTEIANLLNSNECVLTLPAFPRVGIADYTAPPTLPYGPVARSLFTSDEVINPHPRFATLSRNIRLRRGRKVNISLPLFVDTRTEINQPLVPEDKCHREILDQASAKANENDGDEAYMRVDEALKQRVGSHVIMDSSAFGMGCCCLQVTLQARNMRESRILYDQLATMAPLMLALTAGTPAVRGLLTDTDVRWDIISAAMDDRTDEEVSTGKVPKSRYSSIDCYISDADEFKAESYNDIPVPIDEEAYKRLRTGGVDHLLAQHIAHLFIRDPLAIYRERVVQDNETSTDHFENIQSTNWNTVRFKPPPPGTGIGWRTEFRSMEVCLTDFENAAFSVFMVVLSRCILAFNLNLYVPMSAVDTNMARAQQRDAARNAKFHFRKNIFSTSGGSKFLCQKGNVHSAELVGTAAGTQDIDAFCTSCDSYAQVQMSLDHIFNGKPLCHEGNNAGFEFPGLIPLMRGYLDAIKIDVDTRRRLLTYLDFIAARAAGKLDTTAAYLRRFIRAHPDYKGDSVVSDSITRDLVLHCQAVTDGTHPAPKLLGDFQRERVVGDVTREAMMHRMQQTLGEGQDGLLLGSSLPLQALGSTINALAHNAPQGACDS